MWRIVENVEKNVIKETLNLYKKNKSKTAKALGITRKIPSIKMKHLELS